ncbi:MAG: 2Fe-2S iron-sulfur cluster-binding protein [Bacteroidales bacterium]|nr:2Fe-2S iron-sulfur cluster-binding protein [Bacteroidales bacterium]
MIKLKINNKEIQAEEGENILNVAQQQGIDIPNMCYYPEVSHTTSCMVCLVKDNNSGNLIPSCSIPVSEGMDVTTDNDEIHEARKMALELLLSDHVGDCEAPCTIACNAGMDIPQMNRLLAHGRIDEALQVVKKDIVLPSVLGRICPAPCEGACKRAAIDEPLSICLLKRYAGDVGELKETIKPEIKAGSKKVAIIGAGPAGLAAAYHLQLKGVQCTIFDKNEHAGGNLYYSIEEERLPKSVLKQEVDWIEQSGVKFELKSKVDEKGFKELTQSFDAVVIATGDINDEINSWGIAADDKQVKINKNTFQTNIDKVFAVGSITRSTKYAIRAVGQGKDAAMVVLDYVNQINIDKEGKKRFNSRFGKLIKEEFSEYLKESVEDKRVEPQQGVSKGFSKEEMILEAKRCLHCDCRKPNNCKLRDYSEAYGAQQRRFKGDVRNHVLKNIKENKLIFEPEKCIKCGICVQITKQHGEDLGLTYVGRGFDVRIAVPLNKEIEKSLSKTAEMVIDKCPTGALAKW